MHGAHRIPGLHFSHADLRPAIECIAGLFDGRRHIEFRAGECEGVLRERQAHGALLAVGRGGAGPQRQRRLVDRECVDVLVLAAGSVDGRQDADGVVAAGQGISLGRRETCQRGFAGDALGGRVGGVDGRDRELVTLEDGVVSGSEDDQAGSALAGSDHLHHACPGAGSMVIERLGFDHFEAGQRADVTLLPHLVDLIAGVEHAGDVGAERGHHG